MPLNPFFSEYFIVCLLLFRYVATFICCLNIGWSCYSEYLSKRENGYERAVYANQVIWIYYQNPKALKALVTYLVVKSDLNKSESVYILHLSHLVWLFILLQKYYCVWVWSAEILYWEYKAYITFLKCQHFWISKHIWPWDIWKEMWTCSIFIRAAKPFSIENLPLRFSPWHHLFMICKCGPPLPVTQGTFTECCMLGFVQGMGKKKALALLAQRWSEPPDGVDGAIVAACGVLDVVW